MSDIILRVRNLTSKTSHVGEIKDVSFDLYSGECLGIVGRTYSGIKELCSILAKRADYTGSVLLASGKELSACRSSYEASIAPIDQHYIQSGYGGTLIDSLTAVAGHKSLYSFVDTAEITDRFEKLLQEMGLGKDYVDLSRNTKTLSRCEIMIFSILRTLFAQASCLILDNPFQGLYSNEIEQIIDVLKRAKSRGMSFIYVADEHFSQMESFTDRLMAFRHGKISYVFYPQGADRKYPQDRVELATGGKKEKRKGVIQRNDVTSELSLTIKNERYEYTFSAGERIGIYDPLMKIPSDYASLCEYLTANDVILLNGKEVTVSSAADFLRNSTVVIRKDPDKELFLNLSPVSNVTMLSGKRNSSFFTNPRIDRYIYREVCEKYSYLSHCLTLIDLKNCYGIGELLRKQLVVAKWLSLDPDIALFFDLEDTYQPAEQEQSAELFRQLSQQGKIVITISSNLDFLEKTSEIIIS